MKVGKESKSTVRETFPVLEMSCAACAVNVEEALKKASGVTSAAVNYANQTAAVEYNSQTTSPESLRAAVRDAGYDLLIDTSASHEEQVREEALKRLRFRAIGSLLLSIPVVALGMFWMNLPGAAWISLVLSTPVVFGFGIGFFTRAWKQLKKGNSNMDSLVALSTGIAFLFSLFSTLFPEFFHDRGLHPHLYYESAAVVIAFVSLGKWLEERARHATSNAIRNLMGLQPDKVSVMEEGMPVERPLSKVQRGDVLQIKPGERIPVDGVVSSGFSYVDEGMISGEAMPVKKNEGARVFAGTLNGNGSLYVSARQVGEETVLAQIIRVVKQAQGSKAPAQHLADRIAAIFVPAVLIISVITFLAWWLLGGNGAVVQALISAVTVLVIACPCALGLATPTAVMVGIGKGAQHHILIKDAASLELMRQIDTVVFDKTGTITEGKPRLTEIHWSAEIDDMDRLRGIMYALSVQSGHPLSIAIADAFKATTRELIELQGFENMSGLGLKAAYQGSTYVLGSLRWMEQLHIHLSSEMIDIIKQWHSDARSIVCFANDERVFALLSIKDEVKSGSASAIEELKKKGLRLIMLSGDSKESVHAVAEKTGINEWSAGLMPAEKSERITELRKQGRKVAMVGDGINDAEAMATADVSIAMGRGADVAMDVAMMTLITSDLRSIRKAFSLSRQVVNGIRQNLFWAFVYNLIGIPVAAGVLYPINGFLLDPMLAGGAMALSSVSVVLNSLRLRILPL